MKLSELMTEYERRRHEAELNEASAPLSKLYSVVIDELWVVDGCETQPRLMTTQEAAGLLGVAPKTAASWAKSGRLSGARKTSDGGRWRIPSSSVYDHAKGEGSSDQDSSIPQALECQWLGGRRIGSTSGREGDGTPTYGTTPTWGGSGRR